MNEKPEIKPEGIRPLKHICMTIGELPSSYLETMTYYEMLLWFTKFLQERMIPALDNNALAVEELQNLFIALQTYVNNYFDNLDVQEEINNKLDEMLEDGVLEQIIEQFLQLTSLICFDNVASMKDSPNLTNGSYAKTLGFYSLNDGGGATYKIRNITNDDVVDEMFIIEINDSSNELIAELIIEDNINSKQLGIYGDGTHDDTLSLNNAINKLNKLIISDGDYLISDTIIINAGKEIIHKKGKIIYNGTRDKSVILIKGRKNNIILHDIVDINSANNSDYDSGWHGWSNNNYCAIELEDFSYSNLTFNKIANFTTGIKVNGKTIAGTYKMTITGYEILNCKYGLYFSNQPNSWINNDKIEKIMINYSSNAEFRAHSNSITTYGIYQEDVEGDTGGMSFMEFNNLFFETNLKDNFIGFYFKMIQFSEFNMCIPEIKAGTTYALFDMKYQIADPVGARNHSCSNIFNQCNVMGGNNDIKFANAGKVMCSLPQVAKHDNFKFNEIYKENNLLGKMVNIDAYHKSIKGYGFAQINSSVTVLSSAILPKSDYSNVTNDWDKKCLNIGTISPLALIIPCTLNDTFKIVINGESNSQIKCFDSTGNVLTPADENHNKMLSGLFAYNSTYNNLYARTGTLTNYEFTVIDNSVKYILLYIYNYTNNFTIYKNGNGVIDKFGSSLKHLYLLGDVAFSNVKPTSTADSESVIKNQRVYNSNVANLGEYWTFDGTSWN